MHHYSEQQKKDMPTKPPVLLASQPALVGHYYKVCELMNAVYSNNKDAEVLLHDVCETW